MNSVNVKKKHCTVKLCETLWNCVKHCEIVWNTVKLCERLWNCVKHCEIVWNTVKRVETQGRAELRVKLGKHWAYGIPANGHHVWMMHVAFDMLGLGDFGSWVIFSLGNPVYAVFAAKCLGKREEGLETWSSKSSSQSQIESGLPVPCLLYTSPSPRD